MTMQKTAGKELAVRKDEIQHLLEETLDHHKHCTAAVGAVENARDVALFHAWQAGIRLNKMKALIGHGNWQDWVQANFCGSRGVSIDTAQLYMKIDNQNEKVRDLQNPKTEHVRFLKFDTIRKYAIALVPAKEQPEHAGDVKLSQFVSFLNIANEHARLKQRHVEGLQLVDFDEAREEMRELYQLLRWLYGDSAVNPWECSPARRVFR
jgi:hypothetical protein